MENLIKSKISRHLKNLFLDPNNYRFVDNDRYIKIEEKEILDDRIQKRTKSFIEGNKRENIRDLIDSFKSNGFLDVDIIQVRDLGDNNFLVLEGNRRVATLKALQNDYEKGYDIGNLNPEIFRKVPFEIHNNSSKEKHLIIMGLKHISGNKKWSAINQSKLIYDFLFPYWDNEEYCDRETQLCNSLGISKVQLRTSQRAYHLILDYKKSDFGEQFESSDYSLFVEIIKRPSIKEWIEWDDTIYKSKNLNNLQRLFSWLSKVEELSNDEEYKEIEPIITKALEVRDLSLFIKNDNALNIMEETKSISRALVASGEIDKQNYEKSLEELKRGVEKLRSYRDIISLEDLKELKKIKDNFLDLIPKKSSLAINRGNYSICFEHGNKIEHFSKIDINRYKIFENFKIDNLNRINIFAGFNNSGKTSLLEAIYYLTKQNDIVSFLEIIKLKNKLTALNPIWLNEVFGKNEIIDIEGVFNSIKTSIYFNKFEAKDIDKKDDYISSYRLKAIVNDRELDNTIHTFGYETLKRENEKIEILCNSIFKSPYFYNLDEIVETYNKNTQYKSQDGTTAINLVIEFLKKIDSSINDIRLNNVDDIERFIVDSSKIRDKNLEITNYGEGLQRVFEIALSFAYARNGIVCIDEFETAIHHSLLIQFTRFIQELAIIFNVQVFITSHSKESIDAFVNNEFQNSDISAYFLENIENRVEAIYVSGGELIEFIESTNFDLRGDNE